MLFGTSEAVIDPWLLSKLVCPLTRQPLRYDDQRQELISDAARLAYPIRDGTPVMLVEAARDLRDLPPDSAECPITPPIAGGG